MTALSMPRNIRTRATLLASWHAAQRVADRDGAIILNHASAAGMLLEQHRIVGVAILLCPTDPWWVPVREYLAQVHADEQAAE